MMKTRHFVVGIRNTETDAVSFLSDGKGPCVYPDPQSGSDAAMRHLRAQSGAAYGQAPALVVAETFPTVLVQALVQAGVAEEDAQTAAAELCDAMNTAVFTTLREYADRRRSNPADAAAHKAAAAKTFGALRPEVADALLQTLPEITPAHTFDFPTGRRPSGACLLAAAIGGFGIHACVLSTRAWLDGRAGECAKALSAPEAPAEGGAEYVATRRTLVSFVGENKGDGEFEATEVSDAGPAKARYPLALYARDTALEVGLVALTLAVVQRVTGVWSWLVFGGILLAYAAGRLLAVALFGAR